MKCGDEQTVRVWQEIRKPFTLCPCMRRLHQCDYEMLDAHLAGCRTCGFVHNCMRGHCVGEGTVETGDALVCSVTGLCIRDTIFLDSEFVDTVASCGRSTAPEPRVDVSLHTVRGLTAKLLNSHLTDRAHALEQKRWRTKVHSQAIALVNQRKNKACVNLVDVVQQVLQDNKAPCVKQEEGMRKRVVEEVASTVCRVINTCMHILKMPVRPSEVKILVFGLCYLMRSGVTLNGVSVIQRHPELEDLLPPENSLQSIFSFRAKFITDIENKIKFLFRGVQKTALRELFH